MILYMKSAWLSIIFQKMEKSGQNTALGLTKIRKGASKEGEIDN